MISLLSGIDSTASALNAERVRMDVISENIANVNTTKDIDGQPYRRKQVVFQSVLNAAQSADSANGVGAESTQVVNVLRDSRPPRMVYNPTHPEANAQGMVAMPNIDIHEEMVDMIASSRSYEANLAVAKNARSMAMQDLSLGKP